MLVFIFRFHIRADLAGEVRILSGLLCFGAFLLQQQESSG